MSNDGPKHAVFAGFAEVAQAIGHAHRLELLEHLGQGERSVEVLAARAGLSFANTSRHLQHLRRASLVVPRRDGKHVFYRLADDTVVDLLSALRRFSERNVAEVERVVTGYFRSRDSFEPVSREVLVDRLRDGLVTVLDVRPEDEFALGHVPGAVNIPLADLHRRLADLSPDQEIVAYCRGAYCVLSFEAVAALRARGFKVRRLQDGFPEWRVAGLPVETGPAAIASASV
jgi:rhodanese-related sulfurtransferase